jgi:hypothetical protein
MNPLSLSNRCYTAVVYPFLNYVNHANVKVVDASDDTETAAAATAAIHHFERIAALLSRPETEIMAPGRIRENMYMEWGCISSDTLRIILSQATFGLSPFIGSLHRPHDVSADAADSADAAIKGVAVVTPRIMMSFDGGSQTSTVHSVSIYMCEYLAWERYTTSERESLELLETTEYIQKSREIAGEQTLYRYCEIPWFVIPFTTVYTYTFHMPLNAAAMPHLGNGMSVVRVSSANMALFYSFVNECSRDFRCCIFNEFTQLQSLVTHGIYRIYLLLFNQVRVVAAYIFAPSWMTAAKHSSSSSSSSSMRRKTGKNSTKANRISDLHEHISKTSTALVKYIPPVRAPQYDAFGKRVSRETAAAAAGGSAPGQQNSDDSILLLISSIQHRSLCDKGDFVNGFYSAATAAAAAAASTGVSTLHAKTTPCLVMIDTLAHNYRLIDDITKSASTATTTTGAYQLLSQDKWYYILYNAIIHEETVCKDILMI